jgi:hypothetical protein
MDFAAPMRGEVCILCGLANRMLVSSLKKEWNHGVWTTR